MMPSGPRAFPPKESRFCSLLLLLGVTVLVLPSLGAEIQ